tara:strand:- start:39 stop:464 length:426 start_codon:yes stop_codon:yes gene_type:complete
MTAPAKKPKRISPTQLSLRWFRARGMKCAVTERWVKMKVGGFRKDIFGGDLMVLLKGETLNVQAGTTAHHAGKVHHALEHPDVALWLECPTRKFWVMTWAKREAKKKDGAPKKRGEWKARVTAIQPGPGGLVSVPQEIFCK